MVGLWHLVAHITNAGYLHRLISTWIFSANAFGWSVTFRLSSSHLGKKGAISLKKAEIKVRNPQVNWKFQIPWVR
jgi:hypothetical protein